MARRGMVAALLLVAGLGAWWASSEAEQPELTDAGEPETRRWRTLRTASASSAGAEPAEDTGVVSALEPGEVLSLLEEDLAEEPEAEPVGILRVQLYDAEGEAAYRSMPVVQGCEMVGRSYEGPGSWFFLVRPGWCEVQGRAPDGLLFARTDWVDVEVLDGAEEALELSFPVERTGGLGVQIKAHEHGVLVDRVLPGTPAHDMGLVEGDLIVEVDGLPTTALELDEFIEVMTGPAGSDVEFVLEAELDTGFVEERLTLTRQVLTEQS